MPSQVFYRKWRPRSLGDVVGQEPVVRTLLNALITGRIAHAYLFCGPRGTGKTSTGRILAKAVNCLDNREGEPCNSCNICQAVNEGRALDLVEIDGASNRGIEEIRDLKEKINFAPNTARYKVYIIDEVHMLTEPAFNALLKTLEEPPPHAIFILATTESHKIPLTIASRCQRFDFRRLSQSAITSKLRDICEKEGIRADAQALVLIARMATGSLRDAENLLEQLVLHYGLDVTVDHATEELGLTSDHRVRELAHHIASKDIAAGLALISAVSTDGIDLRQFNHALVEYLRNLLMVRAGAQDAGDFAAEASAEINELAGNLSLAGLAKAIRLFAQIDFRADPHSTLLMELALVDCALNMEMAGTETKKPPTRPRTVSVEPEPVCEPACAVSKTAEAPDIQAPPQSQPAQVVREIQRIREQWSGFVDACRGIGSSGKLDALLRGACEPLSLEGDTLVLGFYWEFQRGKVESPEYRSLMEKKLQDVFGVPYHVRCVLAPKNKNVKSNTHASNPVVSEALRMGARIIEEEE
ncbi:MAG: DNA polymerase III subunit gamma/tau [Dehalococcoidia bacterium]|nr:DNA polymerase III subunit gamma/tau [Dehalococcoidia bacterium]